VKQNHLSVFLHFYYFTELIVTGNCWQISIFLGKTKETSEQTQSDLMNKKLDDLDLILTVRNTTNLVYDTAALTNVVGLN